MAGNMNKILSIIIPFSIILCGGCALQSDVIYIDDRVDALEQKISEQGKVSGGTEKVLRTEYARLNNQFDTLNEKLSLIEGRFDEVEFALNSQKEIVSVLKNQSAQIASASDSFSRRLKNLETYTGYEPSDAGSDKKNGKSEIDAGSKTGAPSLRAKSNDVILYDKAKKALDNNQLKTARELFTRLIVKFPTSDRVDNAQFWIGESYYKSKWYQKAILEYQKVIENFPKGNKAPEAYFKQGLAFAALGEVENSRIVLKDLIKKFPGSNAALKAKKKLNKKKK